MGVAEKFSTFCSNLAITQDKRSTISSRYKAITKRLNKDFWDKDSDTMFSRYVGSYGRGTAIHTFSDVDMVFVLPNTVYTQYSQYIYNGPSQLLQAVRQSISTTYPDTSIGADGIVVKVEFSDGNFNPKNLKRIICEAKNLRV
jgi:tRNA nucleotidyltransferase (CCA-adding enzyme)